MHETVATTITSRRSLRALGLSVGEHALGEARDGLALIARRLEGRNDPERRHCEGRSTSFTLSALSCPDLTTLTAITSPGFVCSSAPRKSEYEVTFCPPISTLM